MAGRNDPCPCGSGKKYKKCCLAKDQADRPAFIPAPPRPGDELVEESLPPISPPSPPKPPAPRPVDPQIEAANAFWKRFEPAAFEKQVELYLDVLNEPDVLDADLAVEMLDIISKECLDRKEPDRLKLLIGALRERRPEIYEGSAVYLLSELVRHALRTRRDDLKELALEIARCAGSGTELFLSLLDEFAWYGHLELLVKMYRAAWPGVQESDLFEWAVDTFASSAVKHEILLHCQQSAAPSGADPELIQRIEAFVEEVPREYVQQTVDLVTGRAVATWNTGDLAGYGKKRRKRESKDEEIARRLYHLGDDFVGYWHREEGAPLSKAQLARDLLVEYVLDGAAGQLDDQRSMLERMVDSERGVRPPKLKKPVHELCPDYATFDCFLAHRLDFLNCRYYAVAAVFEAVPAWLRFLELRGLFDADYRRGVLSPLQPLLETLLKLYATHDDPSLRPSLERAWEHASSPAHAGAGG